MLPALRYAQWLRYGRRGDDAMGSDAQPQRATRLAAAFAEEEERSLRLAARVRLVAVLALTVWVTIENGFHSRFIFYYPFLAAFALFGLAPVWLLHAGRYRSWTRYLFATLDIALITVTVFATNPLDPNLLPPQAMLGFGNEIYVFIFLCAAVFTYSPGVVMWTGVCAALAWSLATAWIAMHPGSLFIVWPSDWERLSEAERLAAFTNPYRINVGLWGRQVVIFIVTAAALSVFVRRARGLVERQAASERERANLSRYFSPNLVDELAQSDQPLGPTRQQEVAVLFADLVGFTRLAELLSPEAVIALLRDFHGRMQAAVFAHGGTVDKYIGDAVMATFGTPRVGPSDATNALRAAGAMRAAVAEWNTARAGRGEAAVRIGVGVHYGAVVLGDIGGESRLEFAVLGDTVNVASRLERLTRTLDAVVVASGDVVTAARGEGAADVEAVLADLAPGPPQALRGRVAPVAIWLAARASAP